MLSHRSEFIWRAERDQVWKHPYRAALRTTQVHLLTLCSVYMFWYFTWVFPLSETQFWLHFRDKYCRVLPRQWGISVCNTFIWNVWILFFLPFSVSWLKLSFLPPRSLLYLRRYNHKTTIKTFGTLFFHVYKIISLDDFYLHVFEQDKQLRTCSWTFNVNQNCYDIRFSLYDYCAQKTETTLSPSQYHFYQSN